MFCFIVFYPYCFLNNMHLCGNCFAQTHSENPVKNNSQTRLASLRSQSRIKTAKEQKIPQKNQDASKTWIKRGFFISLHLQIRLERMRKIDDRFMNKLIRLVTVKSWPKYYFYNIKMIYFGSNCSFGVDWQLAYSQLLTRFNQLSSDYQNAVDLGASLQAKIQALERQNQQLRAAKITNSFQTIPNQHHSLLSLHTPSQEQITIKSNEKKARRIKHQSSIETTEGTSYECVYEGCSRIYKSAVSMNLHIKNKHNGGTKKEREEYAKAIIDAQLNGQEPPQVPLNFPPEFLNEFRTTYEYMKKYSM